MIFVFFAAVAVLATGMRVHYVVHAQVLQPVDDQQHVRADGVEYYAYARNLARHGVFSMAPESGGAPTPDSFRDPGYPLFLAGWMKLLPDWDRWYAAVLLSQAVLGGLAVLLAMWMARRWLSLPWLGAAGVLMAVWPHGVASGSFILSEAWVGFLVAAGMAALGLGLDRRRAVPAILGSGLLALAGLGTAVLVPAVPVLVLWLLVSGQVSRRLAAALLVLPLLMLGGWQLRNATLEGGPSTSGRALINLDQGSWATYHAAYQGAARHDPAATETLRAIDAETRLIQQAPVRGLRAIATRLGQAPLHALAWYASKPALLWGWDIRMGQGDIYVYPTRHSPFADNPAWRAAAALCRALNPLLLAGMVAAWALIATRRSTLPPSLQAIGLLALYVTVVHAVLQAEPRYSVPFRPLEILLACWAAQQATQWLAALRQRATTRRA